MATGQMSDFIQHLRRTVLLGDGAGMTDGHLLECFIRRREEAALAALVRRHGPMVWGVCRRVLRNHHDAEDAFQATFLVLVRKAASVVPREMVVNWLYGVAYQTARKARATAAKRGARERQVTEMPEPAAAEQRLGCDLQPLLDEALSRLPDKYRVPIVLCDLGGKTRKEAALQIGCPEGTVAGRLARARAMLAKRLARHGLTALGGALAASASVPTSVMASTIKAVTLVAAGQTMVAGVVSVKVVALTEGMLKAMLLTKLKTAAAVLLVVAALSGAVGLICRTQAEGPTKTQRAAEKTDKGRQPTAGQADEPKPDKPGLSLDDLRGKWTGEKNGIKVALTLNGEKASWQVDFTRSRKPEVPFQSPETGVNLGADGKCVADGKAPRFNLYLPAYLGDNKEIKQSGWGAGKPVGEIQRGVDGTIQLRLIPTGYEDPAQEYYDYPAVEGLVLHRTEPSK